MSSFANQILQLLEIFKEVLISHLLPKKLTLKFWQQTELHVLEEDVRHDHCGEEVVGEGGHDHQEVPRVSQSHRPDLHKSDGLTPFL